MLDFRITLEAKNPDRRCFRQYRVEAVSHLFGSWVVEIRLWPHRHRRAARCFVVRDEGEARRLAQSILKRRASVLRRIGFTSASAS